ncbi:MAG: FecR domain-containing protein, partial [Bryobacterales bacterium]
PRRLLVDDHLGRCPECRRVLAEAKGERKVVPMPQVVSSRWSGLVRWAVAAGVLLGALYLGSDRIDSALAPSGPRATVLTVSGEAYALPGGALRAGSLLAEGEVVRTAAGSRAMIELADGSLVEINQRTELALRGAWSGTTIRLDRGDVMVQAAEQRRGYLRVETRDSVASAKGTIFAVSSGTAGSVVSVVAGAVAVAQPGAETVLTAGQHAASTRALRQVGVREAISWSQDAEKYYSVLAELTDIEQQLAETPTPVRTEAYLLDFLPASAVVYFAIPNLNGTIRQALNLVEGRARENPVLDEWWSSEDGQRLREKLDRVQIITPLLGEEVVCIFAREPENWSGPPVSLLLARVQAGREPALRDAIERIAGEQTESIAYQIVGDLVAISDSSERLASMMLQLGSGASSPFASEIRARYQRGVSWLAGVDVTAMRTNMGDMPEKQLLGLQNMRYLFFEQNSGGGRDDTEATLSFEGSRVGISSWLASPGSAGSAEYVSDQAVAVASGSTRNPRQAFDELLSIAGEGSEFANHIREFETETSVSIADDIASSLGTDFTFSIEQPSLPSPGWMAAFEAINPGVLDDAARRLVDAYNSKLGAEQAGLTISLTQETVNGRSWNLARAANSPITIYWTYDRGYLIASTDRAVATRAIAVRESGTSLVHSVRFQERYPVAANLHSSGFFWLNTNGVLADMASLVNSEALQRLAGSRDPVLFVVNGEMERIHAASRTRLTSLILDLMLVHGAGETNGNSGGDQPPKELIDNG